MTKRNIKINVEINREKPVEDIKTNFVIIYNFIIKLSDYFPIQFIIHWYNRNYNTSANNTYEKRIIHEGNLLEILILGDILFGFSVVILNSKIDIPQGVVYFLVIFAIVRVMDIIIYQMFAIKASKPNTVKSPVRIIFLTFINYFEIIVWFAFFYQVVSKVDSSFIKISHSISDSLYFSVSNIVLLGDNSLIPNHWFAKFVISIQILLGLFIIVIAIARFVPLLSEKKMKYNAKIEDFKYSDTFWLAIYVFIWFLIFVLVNVFIYYNEIKEIILGFGL
ncbi:MAG: hypothetical protein NTZ75_08335 [Euryarchaeota archaeon]|nr:hypothetical protein [Euryarchaeota archaeon]